MRIYGLVGYPLTHSFSADFFSRKFKRENIANVIYKNFPIKEVSAIQKLFAEEKHLCGLNVTTPYKQEVIPLLDELDETAEMIQAVNTILLFNDKTKGFNTDTIGFESSLRSFLGTLPGKALVLGTGGAAKAVVYVLKKLNIDFVQVSRTPQKEGLTYHDLKSTGMENFELIVNTTPLGTFPNAKSAPALPYEQIGATHHLFDLVYNPGETVFLKEGRKRGAKTQNGLKMLTAQAEASWAIWSQFNDEVSS